MTPEEIDLRIKECLVDRERIKKLPGAIWLEPVNEELLKFWTQKKDEAEHQTETDH
jgi:hypothetical protein